MWTGLFKMCRDDVIWHLDPNVQGEGRAPQMRLPLSCVNVPADGTRGSDQAHLCWIGGEQIAH
jgi:hypothetical protein